MNTDQPPKSPANAPKPGRMAHITLAILFAMNLLNYIDRSILGGMLPLIKEEWGVSDTALGALGSAFVITYMLASPVFGWLGDRFARKWIAAAGVVVWSVSTASVALARSFGQLFGLRMVLGIGEAGYATVAPTIITDLYPRESRSKVLALFYVAIPVGYALGYILGGELGIRFGWRMAFLVVGLPGVFLALSILFIKEPIRGQSEAVDEEDLARYLETRLPSRAYLELFRNKSYVYDTIGMILMTFATGAMAYWMPTYFFRIRGIELALADRYFGIALLGSGILGTFFGGWLADKLQVRFKSAYFMVSGIGMLLTVPFGVLALCSPDPRVFWTAIFLSQFFLFLNTGPANAILINVVMPKMRVGAFAINIFLIHALGDVISPPIVGWLSDFKGLQFALLAVVPVTMFFSGIFYLLGMRHVETDTQMVVERIKSSD
jgi:MFS family permease